MEPAKIKIPPSLQEVQAYFSENGHPPLEAQKFFNHFQSNGWRVGAWATKTDLSAEDFGEGSFDKGVEISIPLGWGTGQPSLRRVGGNIRSLSRDGGSRLRVDGRLYDTVRDSHSGQLYQGWGRFWR